ncbi:MAG: hypothetical protein D3916_05390 [Candidatus Electrothrix sp. MAN1_4]|nr:hypothetical protein [Candidatus Electrothrix sp. MAN1_4]
MWIDPIVEEVRKVRRQYMNKFKHDLASVFADMRKKEQSRTRQAWTIVDLPVSSPDHGKKD